MRSRADTTVPGGGREHWIDPAAFFSRGTSGPVARPPRRGRPRPVRRELARKDFTKAHTEPMAAQDQAREHFAAAHADEMDARQRALDADIALQRLAQAGRIADVLGAMARTAHAETVSPPPVVDDRRATLIPSPQAQLRAELSVFGALGGPPMETAGDLAGFAYSATAQPLDVLKMAQNSLGELMRLADNHEDFRPA